MNRNQIIKELGAYCDNQKSCDRCKLKTSREVCDFDNMSNELLKGIYSATYGTPITDKLTGIVEEEHKTVVEILEEVSNEICDHYCKYPNEITDQEEMQQKCINCPLQKLN